jgi:hypothetical protein
MSSQLKSETARANGAKSRGPVTPEGRAASSRNSVRHGLTAKSVVLPTESREQFQLLLDSYLDQFHPATGVEMELVETMAVARWRMLRICAIETSVLSTELVRRAEDMNREFTGLNDDDRLAWVFQKLADHGSSLALLARYEAALNRSYDRAFKQLQILQRAQPSPEPESGPNLPLPNEPKPAPTPPSEATT